MSVLIKICGLMRREDARVAARAGATYAGVILAPGRGRSVTADRALEILEGLPLRRVGVFVDPEPQVAVAVAARLALDVVQLHGSETPEVARTIAASGVAVWKAIRPERLEDLAEAGTALIGVADGILLDGGSGGTGERFAWDALERARDVLPADLRLVVAGGLDPSNVAEAITRLRPDVVDVSSGVEVARGEKDADAVRAFVAAARKATSNPKVHG